VEAKALGLDPLLLNAIICMESSWRDWVSRYEPTQGKYVLTPQIFAINGVSIDTEIYLQKTSFGLCQLMGYNFRAFGYAGSLLQTYDPTINLKYFAMFFKKRCDKYPKLEDKIASYNAGSPVYNISGQYINQSYVDTVLGYYRSLMKAPTVSPL
jgi:hypothetical protein